MWEAVDAWDFETRPGGGGEKVLLRHKACGASVGPIQAPEDWGPADFAAVMAGHELTCSARRDRP